MRKSGRHSSNILGHVLLTETGKGGHRDAVTDWTSHTRTHGIPSFPNALPHAK
ncbi:hypothetical protein CHS0354_039108 [Potamilus streckersoni]|uniref:Uncharacterized protein n=1 Tax=Potamilus streckersoni TaxID=2493646 RepID=A0AAE0TK72_9BIVA|nr:hypothetical protein CHS0354_039108 [Potamilus streckersoni]